MKNHHKKKITTLSNWINNKDKMWSCLRLFYWHWSQNKKNKNEDVCSIQIWNVSNRPAHFSHFSREREMVLRDISREKCGARNCEKNQPNFGQFGAQFDQKLTIFLSQNHLHFEINYCTISIFYFFQLLVTFVILP